MVVSHPRREDMKITVADEREVASKLKTGEFLRRAGISRQTLYTYLTLGLIHEANRTETGRHLFDEKALRRVEIIKRLNSTGYPLREIKDVFFKEGR